jgi:hypothetical protein
MRVLRTRREHHDVTRAAYLALGVVAERMTSEEREEAAKALETSIKSARDGLTRGLGYLGLGHLLGADLRAGETRVLHGSGARRELVAGARNGPGPTRGFSVLALALACRGVDETRGEAKPFLAEAHAVLLKGLGKEHGDPLIRSSYAVAAGVTRLAAAREVLRGLVEDRGENAELRGHAAVALGQIGPSSPELQRALQVALADPRDFDLRRQAALGLALLGGRAASSQLLRQLETGKTERLLAQVVIALGWLGDLTAVEPLEAFAREKDRSELSRSLTVVALGLLVDPEARSSLLKLTWSGNFPARTDSLDEAYTIL